MRKIAVVLSGCGFQDGAEITEAVSTYITLSELGVEYQSFAPNIEFTATNHLTGDSGETRNVLQESARISRGSIAPLEELKEADFDAIVFPGGYGAALRLCDWAQKGAGCTVLPTVQKIIEQFHANSKPIGALCIAPALIAKVLGSKNVTVTIGNDEATASEIAKTGAEHENCSVDDYITDRENKVITTPAYMYGDAAPHAVFKGVQGALKELVEMA